jgi:two-component system, OmpR family, sensor kinase
MFGRLSIRAKLTAGFAAALVLILVLAAIFVYLRVSADLTESIDNGLEVRADEIAAQVSESGNQGPELPGGAEGEDGFSQILDPTGRVVSSTLGPSAPAQIGREELDRATRGEVLLGESEVPGIDGEARVLARPAESQSGSFVVVAGASTEDREDALSGLAAAFAIGAPLALLLASGLGYLLAGRALAPVEAMRRRAAEISAAEPEQRLPVPEADDEISRLGETLNKMLGRLEAGLARERAFVDDASHELRTPLSLHKTELELALRYGKDVEQLRAAIRSAIEEVDRLIQLAEDLLVVARSEQGKLALDLGRVGLPHLLEGVSRRFDGRAEASERALVVEAPQGLQVEGDRIRLEQALTNLVDNALRHGGGEVIVSAAQADGTVELHVRDAGPGFPPEFIDRAFERFSRADSARSRGGSGLGLAIVEAIARAHRGRARVANRPGGGADVWIELPADAR